jgi:hypothetical protein
MVDRRDRRRSNPANWGKNPKGWLDPQREREREDQTRRSNFTWRNDDERGVLTYRVDPDRSAKVGVRDKLHVFLTTSETNWREMRRQDVKGLLQQGYRQISCNEVLAALQTRRPPLS